MEPAARYTVRVLEDGEWRNWGSCDSLADALDAMHGANQWNPVPGREWQVFKVAALQERQWRRLFPFHRRVP